MRQSGHHEAIRVGLVVGAGGPTGGPFIHAALGALEEHTGWTAPAASTIVGTSAGAFVAASIDSTTLMATPAQLSALSALDNGALFAAGLHHRLVSIVRHGGGLLVARVAPRSRPVANYHVPPPPYHHGAAVVTVVRNNGRRVVHALDIATSAETVVRASAAIPGANAPVEIDGELHVDGAVYSAANADLVAVDDHDAVVVIAPMVGDAGGSIVDRSHRAQLRTQLAPWVRSSKPTIVVVPNEVEHADRRNREAFERAGVQAVERLVTK